MISATQHPFETLIERWQLDLGCPIEIITSPENKNCAVELVKTLLALGHVCVDVSYFDGELLAAELMAPELGSLLGQRTVEALEECETEGVRIIQIGDFRIEQNVVPLEFLRNYLESLALTEVLINSPDVVHFPYFLASGEDSCSFCNKIANAIAVEDDRQRRLQKFYFLSFNSRGASFKAKLEAADELAITGMLQVPECVICGTKFINFFCGIKNGFIDSFGASENGRELEQVFELIPDLRRVSKLYLVDNKTSFLFNETSCAKIDECYCAVLKFGIDNPMLPLLSFSIAFGCSDLEVYGESRDGRRQVIYKSGEYVE